MSKKNQIKTIISFHVASYKKSLYNTFYNTISNKLNKNKVKSLKILKMSLFCIGWCSNMSLKNIKNKENFTDEET